MDHRYLHEQSDDSHPATDGLVNLFTKANHDLLVVQHRLEKEFQQIYPDNANPMKLVSRIKKMQEELSGLKEQCQELLSAKQDLIDKARTTLVGNRNFRPDYYIMCSLLNSFNGFWWLRWEAGVGEEGGRISPNL